MGNELRTREENAFFHLMQNVGCMSKCEAIDILLNTYGFRRDSEAEFLIRKFRMGGGIDFADEEKVLLLGSRENKTATKINRDMIQAIAFMCSTTYQEEDLMTAFAGSGSPILTFCSNDMCYEVNKASASQVHKILLLQEKYNKYMKDIKADKFGPDFVGYTTVLMFEESEKEDKILENLDALNLTMPHIIVHFTSSDITQKLEFDRFEK